MITQTPRTDAHFTGGKFTPSCHDQRVPADFARGLELELAQAKSDLLRVSKERDYHKKHELLNCMQAVWFEEALGFKDMPLGTDAHELAKEKLRDIISDLDALKSERDALLEKLRVMREALLTAASDAQDFDAENQVAVCTCCGNELGKDGYGHRATCLAAKIFDVCNDAALSDTTAAPTEDAP